MEIEEDKNKLYKSQELNIYTEQCDLLKMLSIPTFGIYSNDYAFLEQILVIKGNSLSNNSPKNLQDQINYLKNHYPDLDIQYFHLTLSASTLFSITPENISHLSYTPLNFISHPYIFYNCQLNREHKSDVYCAAYIDDNEFDTIKQEDGDTHLRVNPQCNIDDNQLKREVYIHLSGDGYPSISFMYLAFFTLSDMLFPVYSSQKSPSCTQHQLSGISIRFSCVSESIVLLLLTPRNNSFPVPSSDRCSTSFPCIAICKSDPFNLSAVIISLTILFYPKNVSDPL